MCRSCDGRLSVRGHPSSGPSQNQHGRKGKQSGGLAHLRFSCRFGLSRRPAAFDPVGRLSLPQHGPEVLGAGLNRSEWRRRPHLWILVLAPSPQSSSRGLGPRRPSDTLQFVDPLLVAGLDAQSLVGSRVPGRGSRNERSKTTAKTHGRCTGAAPVAGEKGGVPLGGSHF